jgi:hypothetical protein
MRKNHRKSRKSLQDQSVPQGQILLCRLRQDPQGGLELTRKGHVVKYSCKIDPSHGSFSTLIQALDHIIKEAEDKKISLEKPLKEYVEVHDK